jgi:putative hydrolase of the HAD superfamily
MALIRGIVFDLDDTLLLERDYVRTGFLHVAEMLDGVEGLSRDDLFSHLWDMFEQGVRRNTFDRLLETYPSLTHRVRAPELIRAYRTHTASLQLVPGAPELLGELGRKGYRLGLLSDGSLESQRSKVRVLGLEALFEPVVLTDRWSRAFWKPHPRGYEYIAEAWQLLPDQLVYIGDNPKKDFITPRRLGWHTIRVRMPGQLRCAQEATSLDGAADAEVDALPAVMEMLEALCLHREAHARTLPDLETP